MYKQKKNINAFYIMKINSNEIDQIQGLLH